MALDLTPNSRLGKLVVRGSRLQAEVADRVLSASIDMALDGITTLNLTATDPRLQLMDSRLLAEGAAVDYLELHLRAVTVELEAGDGGPQITVTARAAGVQKMRRDKGARVWKKISPTSVVTLLAKAAGLKVVAQPSATRKQVARKKDESSWALAGRLASEVGFACFEVGGTLYFGKPSWLIDRPGAKVHSIAWDRETGRGPEHLMAFPSCHRSEDAKRNAAQIDLTLKGGDAEGWRPGDVLDLSGVPQFNGKYLVSQVTIPLNEGDAVTITAVTPVDPAKQKVASSSNGRGGSRSASPTVERFVQHCLDQSGDSYVYGAEAAKGDANPDAFDCSELVEWATSRVGVYMPDGSSAQREFCRSRGKLISIDAAVKTRGALLFGDGHVAVSLGNGKTIEARGRAYGVGSFSATSGRAWTTGGLVPGLSYPRKGGA